VRDQTETYQDYFERRWGHLRRARVRALAWLLDAPDLLDVHDPHWEGRIATIGPVTPETERWLAELDADPAPLDAALGSKIMTRLGLYAEKLMAFYFAHQGRLVAHGLQVRPASGDTVGEFDFLLDDGQGRVEHIEFATKFYLLQEGVHDTAGELAAFDTFVGPNLADSLGRKMRKVFERQLSLGQHPMAQALLPRPVTSAKALVKGWLFYPAAVVRDRAQAGISARHCRGFWCSLSELEHLPGDRFLVLPRLQWLPPFRAQSATWMLDRAQLRAELEDHFRETGSPVLVSLVKEEPGRIVEFERGFIVPDDWRERAGARLHP
jgi:hypothetical protein